jgi:ketosteroid isomerase-like protein
MTCCQPQPAGPSMNSNRLVSMRCMACGATWLSPGGRVLVDKGERCLHCEGELTVADEIEANLGTVRQAWDRLLAGDIDGLVDQHHPEAEVHSLAGPLVKNAEPVYRGHTGVRRCIEGCLDASEPFPNELRGFGDRVLTLGKLVLKDGTEATLSVAWIHRLREGKILSFHAYLSPADALRDLQPETG